MTAGEADDPEVGGGGTQWRSRSPETAADRSSDSDDAQAEPAEFRTYGSRTASLLTTASHATEAEVEPMSPALSFLVEPTHTGHTREYLRAFSRAMKGAGLSPRPRNRLTWWISRLGATLRLERHFMRLGSDAQVVAVAWPRDGGGFPQVLWSEVIPYVSDCWPADYDRWASKLRRMQPRVVFVSARGSADYLRGRLPNTVVHWLPEAIDADDWDSSRPLTTRGVDVLELGRKHPRYHEQITGRLGDGVSHRFARAGSHTPVFPGEAALRAGLADTKIQICFPKSITHPLRAPDRGAGAGGLETVTQRYFEAIASGSLVVGHGPRELVDLFGYDPVIAADLEQPAEQLHELLDGIEQHQPFVDRNLARLREVGTWDARVAELLQVLAERGYEVPRGE